jgi:hypothetical protein
MLRKKKSTSQKTEPVKESKSLLESLTERLNAIPPTITETRRIGTGFGVRKRTVEVPNPEYVALQNQINELQTAPPEPPKATPEPAQTTPEPSFMGPVAPANLPTDIAPLSLSGIQGLLMPKVEAPVEPPVEQPKIAVAPKLTQKTVTPQKATPAPPKIYVDPVRETTRPTEEFAPPTLASLSSQAEAPSVTEFVGPPGPANIPTDTAPLTLSGIEGLLKPTTSPVNVEELKQALAGVGDLSGGVSFAPDIKTDVPLDVGTVESDKYIEDNSRFSRAKLDPTGQKIYDQLKQQRESMEKAIGAEKASELYTSIGDLTQEETLAMMASELRDTGITDIYKVKQQDGIVQAPIQYGEIEAAGEGAAREGYYYRDPRTNEIKEVDPSQVKDFQAAVPGRYTDSGEGGGEYVPGSAPSGYVDVPVKQYVNTETGELLKQDISRSEYQTSDNILGDSSVAKRTYTGTGVQFTPDGVPIYFSTGFKQPSSWVRFRDQVRALAPLAVAFIPGIGQAFTAAASSILGAGASQAAVGALSKGLASAVAGTIATGDLEKGILSGLTSGALGYGLGALQGLADVAYIPEVSASQLEAIGTGPLDYGVAAMEPSVAAEALTSLASDPNIAEELSNLSSTGALASIATEVPVEFLQDIASDIPTESLEKLTDAVSDPNLVAIQDPEVLSDFLPDVADVIETGGPTDIPSSDLLQEAGFDIPETPSLPDTRLEDILDQSALEDIGVTDTGLPSGEFDITDIVPKDSLPDITPPDLGITNVLPDSQFDITDVVPEGVTTDISDVPPLGDTFDITDIVPGEELSDITDVVPPATEEIFDITDVVPGDVAATDIQDLAEATDITDTIPSGEALDVSDVLTEDIPDITDVAPSEDTTDFLAEGVTQAEDVLPEISEAIPSEEAFDITDVLSEEPITDVTDAVPADTALQDVVEPTVFEAAPDETFDITDVIPGDDAQDITDVLSDELNAPESAIGTEISEEPFDITDVAPEDQFDITDVSGEVVPELQPDALEVAPDVSGEVFDITDVVPTEELPDITDAVSEGLTSAEDVTPSITQDVSVLPEEPFLDIEEPVFEPDTFEPISPDYQDIDAILAEAEAPEFDITDIVPEATLTSPQFDDVTYDDFQQGLGSYTGAEPPVEDISLGETLDFVEPDIFDEDFGVELTQTVQNDPGFLPEEFYDVPPLPKSLSELADITDVLESTPGGAMTPDEFLQAVEESSVGDPYIASELAGSLPSDWDLPDLSYLNTGVAQDLAAAGSDTGMLPGFDTDLSYLNTSAGQEAAAAGSDTGNLPGNVMTPEQVADALKGGAGDPYVASEIAGVDPSDWDLPDPTDMQEFFKSPAGKLAYNRLTSFLLNKLKGDAGLSSAANLINQSGQSGIAGLGASAPSVQFGYIPDFDITKAFSPTLYALRQRGQ